MFSKFLWKFFVKRLARSQGFMDPLMIVSRIGRFGQPSEVLAPLELLRATAILHIRGLLNAQAIQHNLDWIWPYWVHQQFDPRSSSFIPRAFSLTHINLTHRNWTAVGLPDEDDTPLVDPRGLVMPFWDSWSIDVWVVNKSGPSLIPSKLKKSDQKIDLFNNFRVVTYCHHEEMEITTTVEMVKVEQTPVCRIAISGRGGNNCDLVVSLRPYNPEGISLIKTISVNEEGKGWKINNIQQVNFDIKPLKHVLSTYRQGDVYAHLNRADSPKDVTCDVEMASAAAVFPMKPAELTNVTVNIPLRNPTEPAQSVKIKGWEEELKDACAISIPDERYEYLFNVGLRTLLIHTAKDVYAGPFVYKRFWFRDAVFITHALLCCGFHERAERIIDLFAHRQKMGGLFESQQGEWDSNGQVLWLIEKFCKMTDTIPKPEWKRMIVTAGQWIMKKRLPEDKPEKLHAGLMPSGFSAEHFGPNDYYYWDDFWSVAGLNAAAYLTKELDDDVSASEFSADAKKLNLCIEKSLGHVAKTIGQPAMPSSPYRRLDSASVGSLVSGYPLNLWGEKDPRLIGTAEYLFNHFLVHDGFFHDMSHSGINPYLTLHIAQTFLRAGDSKCLRLMHGVANAASSTGQWPEAVHPQTSGGCMGDGQHIWASAEWLMMLRNCFVREEEQTRKLILCSAVPFSWFIKPVDIVFGPVWTVYGKISLNIKSDKNKVVISWEADWHAEIPPIEIHFAFQRLATLTNNEKSFTIDLNNLPA